MVKVQQVYKSTKTDNDGRGRITTGGQLYTGVFCLFSLAVVVKQVSQRLTKIAIMFNYIYENKETQ